MEYAIIKGMDDVLPITDFVKNNKDLIPPEDTAIPIKVLPYKMSKALIPLQGGPSALEKNYVETKFEVTFSSKFIF